MNKPKTLLQRVQSRISKRRNLIGSLEHEVMRHYVYCSCFGHDSEMSYDEVVEAKAAIKEGAESQKLDKEIYQLLLKQERDKFDAYFRSAYPAVTSPYGDNCGGLR